MHWLSLADRRPQCAGIPAGCCPRDAQQGGEQLGSPLSRCCDSPRRQPPGRLAGIWPPGRPPTAASHDGLRGRARDIFLCAGSRFQAAHPRFPLGSWTPMTRFVVGAHGPSPPTQGPPRAQSSLCAPRFIPITCTLHSEEKLACTDSLASSSLQSASSDAVSSSDAA